VAHAAGLGDDVPLDGLHRIGLRAPPYRENAGETVLRHRVALARRLRQQDRRQVFVLGHTRPVEQRDGIFELGIGVVGGRGGGEKPRRPDYVLWVRRGFPLQSPRGRAASTTSFGTPRPSLYKVASAYWASGLPTCAALRKSAAARARSCGNN